VLNEGQDHVVIRESEVPAIVTTATNGKK